jgi:hypothetical protein
LSAWAKKAIEYRGSVDSPRAGAATRWKFEGSRSSLQRMSMSPTLQVIASSVAGTGVHA